MSNKKQEREKRKEQKIADELYATINADELRGFHGNPQIKSVKDTIQYTPEQIEIYKKCIEDPFFFINNFVKIVTLDKGLQTIKLRDYQREMIKNYINNRFNIILAARQCGKSVSYVCFILWYVLFNTDKTVAILANKGSTAAGIVQRVELAYYNLPKWLQQSVLSWNRGSFELANNCKVFSAASSSQTIRGASINCLIIDECVNGQNTVILRNKKTGEVKRVTLKEFYDSLS